MRKMMTRPLALLTVAALAACGGGGSSPNTKGTVLPPLPAGTTPTARIAGVGDSLTFGTQSGGNLGVPGQSPLSILPGGVVPPTQENGFWTLMYEQATGTSAATMANPAKSVLPLIAAPGLGAQLVPTTPPAPFAATHTSCDSFNIAAFTLSSALATTRANPATIPLNVAVPGQTVHEALAMTAPLTGPAQSPNCTNPPNPNDATAGGLQTLVGSESDSFWPILGNFQGQVTNLDQVDAAVSLHPTLTTVWLGANDILKFTFSGGNPVASDSPAQMQADLTTIIQRLQAGGSQVIVANLPDVINIAQFFHGGAALTAALTAAGVPAPVAANVSAFVQATYHVSATGALTETGFFTLLGQLAANQTPNLDPNGAGSGIGLNYIPDTLAVQVQTLNTAYNASIAAAATATKAPLVDIHGLFVQIGQAGGVPINPPKCCNLQFGGGLTSFDGLHPSNTGYALVANAFIQTADTGLGLSIPQLSNAQIQAIYATDPYAPH